MDSLPPLFASAQDAETSKEDVGTAMAAQPITDTEPITETTGHRDPQADPQSELASPVVAPTPINPALLHQPNDIQLYSPTKAEIESHPIRQRLSIVQDNSDTAIGAAHPDSPSPLEESNSLRQVEEGSERPETVAMSDAPKEGDQGMCATHHCYCATSIALSILFARTSISSRHRAASGATKRLVIITLAGLER